jgi:hypothetical protein
MASATGATAFSTAFPRVAFVRERRCFVYVSYVSDRSSVCFPPSLVGCFATWCPCYVYSGNKQHLRSLQTQGAVLPAGGEKTDDQCCIYCGLVVLGYAWVLQVTCCHGRLMRTRVLNAKYARPRFALVKKSASAMVSVAVASATALSLGAATPVLSPRSAGKSSWKSRISSDGFHNRRLLQERCLILLHRSYDPAHDLMKCCIDFHPHLDGWGSGRIQYTVLSVPCGGPSLYGLDASLSSVQQQQPQPFNSSHNLLILKTTMGDYRTFTFVC